MSGRPVQILAAAAVAAAASLVSMNAASAGCGGCGYSYAAPVAYYSAPVVYSYSYAAPATYAAPCGNPCGYGSYGYSAPMYVVNQGPAYTAPVTIAAEPTPAYEYGYRRSHPYYGGGSYRWRHRHWHRGYGYRHHGYRHHGYRYGAVAPSFRYRAAVPGIRYGVRPGYGFRHHHAPRFAVAPRMRFDAHRAHRMHMHRAPGFVHPRQHGPIRSRH